MKVLLWRAGDMVRGALGAVGEDHALRRAYRMLRRAPGVSALWRVIFRDPASKLAEAGYYESRGGRFRPVRSGAVEPADVASTVPLDDVWAEIIARAQAFETPYEAEPGRFLLVNCGLAAGGAERQIVNTLTGLKARGYEPVFRAEQLNRAAGLDFHAQALQRAGVDAAPAPRRLAPADRLYEPVTRPVAYGLTRLPEDVRLEILDMVLELRALRPQVVHLWQDQTSVKHGLAAAIAGTPRIVLGGRNVNPTHFGYFVPWLKAGYLALAALPNVVFINNSEAGAQSYADWLDLPRSRFHVLRNGVEFPAREVGADEAAAFRATLGVAPEQKLVAGAFRLSAEKRPILWLRAAAALRARRPDVRFVLAGAGPLRAAVEKEIRRLGLSNFVHLLGETPDITPLMAAQDVFFLSSEFEGTPNVVLEAQWFGRPALVTHAGGAPESVDAGRTGLVADDESPEALAARLDLLLSDPAWRARAESDGRAFVAMRYGMDRMIGETLDAYLQTGA